MISTVFLDDCLVNMKNYPDKCFDLAVVDPPYNDYFSQGGSARKNAPLGVYNLKSLNGNKPTNEYFDELIRISKNQIIWGSNWFERYFGAGGIVWFKDNTGNYSPCELAYQSFDNHIRHFEFRWNGMLQGNMKDKEVRIHPTQKPVQLYSWIYRNYLPNGGTVIDTHLGSGSNRIAADKAGNIDFTAYENDKTHYDAQEKRFNDYRLQLRLW